MFRFLLFHVRKNKLYEHSERFHDKRESDQFLETYFSINKREQKAPGLTVVLLKVWPGIQLQI